jgi:predicted HTH domain antitoxin
VECYNQAAEGHVLVALLMEARIVHKSKDDFDLHLKVRYQRYRRGEISLGRLAQELGVISWELTHLLESRGWPVYNLPEADK